jgi:hypothetical protein
MDQDSTPQLSWVSSGACADGACVQVASDGDGVFLRDGKEPDGNVLSFTRAEWTAFLNGVKTGNFDLL